MTSVALYILSAAAVVAGAWLIMSGIRNLRRWMADFDQALLFEMPFSESAGSFDLPADGTYSLWIKGPRFRLNALTDHEPRLREEGSTRPVALDGTIFRTNMTRGRTNVMKIALFTARGGRHELDLLPAASVSPEGVGGALRAAERAAARKLAGSGAAAADCFLQIRDETRMPGNWLLSGILPILLGALLLACGIAAGTLTQVMAEEAMTVGTACNMTGLERLASSLAEAAGGTLPQIETGLGLVLQKAPGSDAADAREFSGGAAPGSAHHDMIETVVVRLAPQTDRPAMLTVTPRADGCLSMDNVIRHFGRAAAVEAAPAPAGKSAVLIYEIGGRDIALGFAPEPGGGLVSVAVRFDD